MRSVIGIVLLTFILNQCHSQVSCVEDFSPCDSLEIDTVFFSHFPENGDRIHFTISSTHDLLYAPSIKICSDDQAIQFVNDEHFFTSIFGPITVPLYYEFENWDDLGDIFEGRLIVDNANNTFGDCEISFSISTIPLDIPSKIDTQSALEIFPNPSSGSFYVKANSAFSNISQIQVYNGAGEEISLSRFGDQISIIGRPSGVYIVKATMSDESTQYSRLLIN